MSIPSPQEQIEFLQKVQRLLSEGLSVASYKFALLRSLADLAVLKGDDSGAEIEGRCPCYSTTRFGGIDLSVMWPKPWRQCPSGNSNESIRDRPCGLECLSTHPC